MIATTDFSSKKRENSRGGCINSSIRGGDEKVMKRNVRTNNVFKKRTT